jgi:hypothetical protein
MQVCVLFIGVMATVIPPSAKKLTSSKSEIQISYDGSSSLRSKGRQLNNELPQSTRLNKLTSEINKVLFHIFICFNNYGV